MAPRQFRTTVEPRTLGILATADVAFTTLTLNSVATNTLPTSYPYTLVIDPDTSLEEIVTVTAPVGLPATANVLTVLRAQDNTTVREHAVGAVVRHMVTARDLQEPQEHMTATGRYLDSISGTYYEPHGLGSTDGAFVGASKTQTLTNKTIQAATLSGTTTNSGTITGGIINATSVPASGITGTTLPAAITGATGLSIVESQVVNLVSDLAAKAPLASPTFTGTVTIPTGASITSPIIDGATVTGSVANSATFTGGSFASPNITLAGGGSISLGAATSPITANGLTITATNVSHLYGTTSNIQNQLDSKPTVKIQRGQTSMTVAANTSTTSSTIPFSTAFGSNPTVVLTPVKTFSSTSPVIQVSLETDATTTGFVIRFINGSGTSITCPINWIAIGS
jgi:hypothetical protein